MTGLVSNQSGASGLVHPSKSDMTHTLKVWLNSLDINMG